MNDGSEHSLDLLCRRLRRDFGTPRRTDLLTAHAEVLRALRRRGVSLTILSTWLRAEHSLEVSPATLSRFFARTARRRAE